MEFPRMVYRVGSMIELDSGVYDYKVIGAAEYEQALNEGWRIDQYAAKEAAEVNHVPDPVVDIPDNAPPTREELETKAAELGLKFDGRTSDKKLGALIAEALKG